MPSGFEDQAVDSINFGDLSDEDLQKIADSDDRSTAQSAAQAELNRREAADSDDAADAGTKTETKASSTGPTSYINQEGLSLDPDWGQAELQARQDEIDAKGYIGQVTDPTPNENYQAQNSAKENDLPTPETDPELWEKARDSAVGTPRRDINQTAAQRTGGDK